MKGKRKQKEWGGIKRKGMKGSEKMIRIKSKWKGSEKVIRRKGSKK